ncbi:MAG: glycosyltransferase [Candidatus Edwardsbacteria bacterium]|nr:glycosyltransferase [Candidatus Edwardsbacteria bacterium]
MKALVVSHSYVVGVNQKKLELLAATPNLSLALAVPRVWADMGQQIPLQKSQDPRYRIYGLDVCWHRHLYAHFYSPLELWRVLSRERPDMVYIEEEPQSFAALQTVGLAKAAGCRTVLLTWENLLRKFPLYKRALQQMVFHNLDGVIGGTGEALETARSLGFTGPGFVNPQFGVDEEEFRPKDVASLRGSLGLSEQFVIGFIARLLREKGILTLIEAAAKLEHDFRLLVVGKGPIENEARRQADRAGIRDKVVWAGIIPHILLSDYMNLMDVFVLPSIPARDWKEQFGHVVIEAMACRVPVVGSDCGAIPELMGEGGLVFPAGEHVALADCLRKLHADRALRINLGNKGRQRAIREYSNATVANRLVGFLRAVAGDT